MPEPNLSVIVLAWNHPDTTASCIESIRANTDVAYELIVVDNGSDPPLEGLMPDCGDAIVRNEENLGFAAGMNTGLAGATTEYVVFLNNDTVVPENWAGPLLDTLLSDPGVGIVVPAVTSAGNPISVRSAPGTERIVTQRFRDLPSAVAYVMRTATIRSLGGWDERYTPATAEDLDLLWQVWVNGLDVVIDERVLIEHAGSATFRSDLARSGPILRTNRQVFTERWAGDDPQPVNLGGVDDATFRANLEIAAVAAHWMRRAFSSEDEAAAAQRALRSAETQGTTAESQSWLQRITGRSRH